MENHHLQIVFTADKLKYMFSAGRWEAMIDRSLHYSYKYLFFLFSFLARQAIIVEEWKNNDVLDFSQRPLQFPSFIWFVCACYQNDTLKEIFLGIHTHTLVCLAI